MPFRIPTAIEKFKWELAPTGQPVANVIRLGNGRWVECCPLCSCLHDITTHQGDTFEPRCLWREWNRPDYQKWLKRHPQAADHRCVLLVDAVAREAPNVRQLIEPLPKRAAARRKAA